MKKSWLADAAIGLVLTLVVAAGYVAPAAFPLIETIELKTYDRRAELRQRVDPGQEIVLVKIDDASLNALGRWPWPRARHAELLDKLKEKGQPRVIGLDIIYSEPDGNQALLELAALQKEFQELVVSRQIVDKTKQFDQKFSSAAVRLDNDSKLLASLRSAGNVMLPMYFGQGLLGAKPEEPPAAVSSSTVGIEVSREVLEPSTGDGTRAVFPVTAFAEASMGVGFVNVDPDIDGVVRRELPVQRHGEARYPSYAVQLAAAFMGLKASDAVLAPGRELKLGKVSVPLDASSRMMVSFNGPEATFRSYPIQDVMNDKVSWDVFRDRIVIVGPTAAGIGTLYVTPVTSSLSSVELVANVVENILHKRFLVRPPFAERLELGLIAFVGLFIMLVLPRLRALWGFLLSALLTLGLVGAGTYLFIDGQWIKIAYPGVLLLSGYLVVVSKRFFVTEKGKELVEASAIETNKMLGLSFQGQGMLDMAFEKFRLCPLDDNMKDTLYNLALDFERKRQFSKAGAVLEHIAAKDPKYKDVVEKASKLKQASEGAVFGGVGGAKKEGTVMLAGGSTKPTLGRYEIEKELGRGAMGIVYLGKDPKINRQVAIKTMMLEEGSDAAEAKAVKERFFREAESAGTLNHPNIVRIFDAGEEQDIAYIAMELLDGHDFTRYVTKDKLLPIETVLDHVAKVADALDYAHAQGIVHRDIKPANIMLLNDGTVRVADFGIARITASSKTATGTVMGTPSYMSPEQVAGKKVDGRSDLFSLTVALYELLCGEKPFKGGEGIGTLLFQIANDPHPDPLAIRPDLPACLKTVLDKGLAKNPDERYLRGSQLSAALRECLAIVKTGGLAPALSALAAQPTAAPADRPKPEPTTETTIPGIAPGSPAADVLASLATVSLEVESETEPAPPPPAAAPKTDEITLPAPAAAPAFDPDATLVVPVDAPAPQEPPAQLPSADSTIKLTMPGDKA